VRVRLLWKKSRHVLRAFSRKGMVVFLVRKRHPEEPEDFENEKRDINTLCRPL
jgi:hypothetical protein